jgi:hypothetical protein
VTEPRAPGSTRPPRGTRHVPGAAPVVLIALLAGAWSVSAQTPQPSIDELVAKAARQGSLRVVAELRIDAPGPPSREAISQAQDLVLQELAGTSHRVTRRFATIPFLGLIVSAEALQRLAGSLFVAGIREDLVMRLPGPRSSP